MFFAEVDSEVGVRRPLGVPDHPGVRSERTWRDRQRERFALANITMRADAIVRSFNSFEHSKSNLAFVESPEIFEKRKEKLIFELFWTLQTLNSRVLLSFVRFCAITVTLELTLGDFYFYSDRAREEEKIMMRFNDGNQ